MQRESITLIKKKMAVLFNFSNLKAVLVANNRSDIGRLTDGDALESEAIKMQHNINQK